MIFWRRVPSLLWKPLAISLNTMPKKTTPKVLKASFEKNCIGCELCVLEVQRQLGRVGLDGSPIRIFRKEKSAEKISFSVEVDPSVNTLEIEKIKEICPALVFTLEDSVEEKHELVS